MGCVVGGGLGFTVVGGGLARVEPPFAGELLAGGGLVTLGEGFGFGFA